MDAQETAVLKAMKAAGEPVRPGDVAKMLGLDSKVVSKAVQSLKKQGKVVSPKRCFWEPK
jgi:Mn-dependent DtxR family transcriptional regulator